MTLDDLRAIAGEVIPKEYHYEIEPYTLTDNELFWRVRCRKRHSLNPEGWHIDIQLGESIENHWISDKARAGTVKQLLVQSVMILRVKEQQRNMLRVTEAVNGLIL